MPQQTSLPTACGTTKPRARDRADGDAAAAVEVGREHDGVETSRRVAPEGRDAARALGRLDGAQRAFERDEAEQLLDGIALDAQLRLGEQRDGYMIRVVDLHARPVEATGRVVQLVAAHDGSSCKVSLVERRARKPKLASFAFTGAPGSSRSRK
jgi:hypothetical protein